jgi:hypothetical protein
MATMGVELAVLTMGVELAVLLSVFFSSIGIARAALGHFSDCGFKNEK